MTETLLEKQVRLVLEGQCMDAFERLLRLDHRVALTVFVFDYGEDEKRRNVAFKSTLSREGPG